MSKELDVLEKFDKLVKTYHEKIGLNENDLLGFSLSLKIIEKERKALEIIKRKGIDINALKRANNCAEYNSMAKSCIGLEQEEYEIILGVYYE